MTGSGESKDTNCCDGMKQFSGKAFVFVVPTDCCGTEAPEGEGPSQDKDTSGSCCAGSEPETPNEKGTQP